jgi:hypothetical protein
MYIPVKNLAIVLASFTSDILNIFCLFIIKSSICCISFCFVALQDIYFIFAHDLARIFTSEKNLPDPSQNQMASFQARFCEK